MHLPRKVIALISTVLLTPWISRSLLANIPPSYLDIVQGKVILQREGWTTSQEQGSGTRINQGDTFLVPRGSITKGFCPGDIYLRDTVPTEEWLGVSSVCSPNRTDGTRGSENDPILGGGNSSVPYIISPRRTFLHSDELRLRWNHVQEARSYTVSITKGSIVQDWRVEVTDDKIQQSGTGYPQIEVDFPDDLLIEPGDDDIYLVVVAANTGQSSQEECAFSLEKCLDTPKYELPKDVDSFFAYTSANASGWGFRILSEAETNKFRDELKDFNEKSKVDRIQGRPLTEEAKALASVNLYEKYELYNEAIKTLRKLVEDGNETIAIHYKLGRLYGYVGLNLLAIESYSKALELAKGAGDAELEKQALAQLSLAQVYSIMGDSAESKMRLEQAKQICQRINEIHDVNSELPDSEKDLTCGNIPQIEELLGKLST